MSLFTITLDSGRILFFEALYTQPSHLGVGAGEPDREANREILRHQVARAKKMWPSIPVLVFDQGEGDSLPKFCVMAKAFSTTSTTDKQMDASELVIVFFTDQAPYVMDTSTEKKIGNLPWEAHAQDFNW